MTTFTQRRQLTRHRELSGLANIVGAQTASVDPRLWDAQLEIKWPPHKPMTRIFNWRFHS